MATIVLADDASARSEPPPGTGPYLGKVTGGTFRIVREAAAPKQGTCLYVGPTRFARRNGLDAAKLGPEEWVHHTAAPHLILTGGRPRGTLYSVYRFLEDRIGVHWWTPFDESVPRKPDLKLAARNRRGQPVFRYRDIYMLYGNDGGRFAARNRLNREGDARIDARYGGCMDYGPPYHVHTFYMYLPPEQYLAEHPDWFSLIDGKRVGGQAQLCLTNQEMRAVFLQKLKRYIEESRAAAKKAGEPAPLVFSVSQNDWGGQCQCEPCQAITKAEGSEAGPARFRQLPGRCHPRRIPRGFLDTWPTCIPSRRRNDARARQRDHPPLRHHQQLHRTITDPENRAFRSTSKLHASPKPARVGLRRTYATPTAALASLHTYPVDYRFYAENNVEGVFTEHEYPILADMRDLKVWMMMKLLEDPYRDYNPPAPVHRRYYGPAAPQIREYLRQLQPPPPPRSAT